MAYVRKGQVVDRLPALQMLWTFLLAIWNFFAFFFKTLLNPSAADDYAQRSRRGGGGGSGYGRRPPGGGRVTGLSDLRDASGAAACGAGG